MENDANLIEKYNILGLYDEQGDDLRIGNSKTNISNKK